mgnify:FL=1
MFIKIVLFMILFHIIDDFVLQPISLSNLKQKKWWEKQEGYSDKYKDDYKVALAIHSISWSIMIHIPLVIMFPSLGQLALLISFIVNAVIHYFIDDLKANKLKINLFEDQMIHFCQICTTLSIIMITI